MNGVSFLINEPKMLLNYFANAIFENSIMFKHIVIYSSDVEHYVQTTNDSDEFLFNYYAKEP